MNTAFSKAFLLDEGGNKAGLPGNNFYIDESVVNAVIEGTIIISSIMKPFLLMVPIKCPFMALIFIASSYFIKIDINHYTLHESDGFLW